MRPCLAARKEVTVQSHHLNSGAQLLHRACLVMLLGLSAFSAGVQATATDISNTPLATTSDITAKPNVMFILDDSGSMSWAFMPDDMSDSNAYGYKSSQCNGVAYNPSYDYSANLPVNPDGTPYPHASFTAAPSDGFQMSLSSYLTLVSPIALGLGSKSFTVTGASATTYAQNTVVGIVNSTNDTQWMVGTVSSWNNPTLVLNITASAGGGLATDTWRVGPRSVNTLDGSTYYKYNSNGTQPAMGWTYNTSGLINTTFSNECKARPSSPPNPVVFDRVTVTTTSAEAQRYADWYAYYRTRVLMMRTAAGRSFSPIDSKYRVGFTTISAKTAAPSSKFLPVAQFDDTQKAAFFSDLYRADPGNSTPLRGALSKIGRYFANKAPGQTSDPMEYACQRNYSLLSTDGYWNTGDETATYGPLQLDGTTLVGQQDGNEVKPYWDGLSTVVTTKTPYSKVDQVTSTTTATTTVTTYSTGVLGFTTSGCSSGKKRYQATFPTSVATTVVTTTLAQSITSSYTNTSVVTQGVETSNTNGTVTPSTVTTGTQTSSATSAAAGAAYVVTASTSTCATTPAGSSAPTTVQPSPVTVGPSTSAAVVANVSLGTYTAGTPQTPVVTYLNGSSNTLADVSEYFYATDLRTPALSNCTGALGTDVCNNEVPANGLDKAESQHMTTFTLGLGVNGILPYNKNYLDPSLKSGSYYEIKRPDGTLTWPISESTSSDVTHVDDLWHAAVNGRGQYWSASDPSAVSEAIGAALSNVQRTIGASSSAATSSLKPVKGTGNQVFVAKYTTKAWTGELVAYSLEGTTGAINTDTEVWNAATAMASVTPAQRVIYYAQPGATTPTLRNFNFTNLSADGLGGHFTNYCSKTVTPTQCPDFDTAPRTAANTGSNLVDYLRGDGSMGSYAYSVTSGTTTTTKTVAVYRQRESILGDIINASPVYMSKPPFQYSDVGYSDFVSAQASRRPVVFSAANDGMLHAFAASTVTGGTAAGSELWAFIPTAVMPDLYRLADTDYATKHHFFVDGTPTVGDIKVGTAWKTILVGGLNAGGKSYYALDVTDPLTPKLLWEFTDANMGLTYGNPIITKRTDGTWVVVVSSGYNNTSGDGNGRLYVLNGNTGAQVSDIASGLPTMVSATTPAGTSGSPSGLGKVNAWIDDSTNNTSTRFYGGDLLGNLWRFDIDNQVLPAGKEATLIATFQTSGGPQPITTRPETAEVTYNGVKYPIVLVGTGRYLGLGDIADKSVQSVYGVKDSLTATGLGDVRQRTDVVVQTLTDVNATSRRASAYSVNWGEKAGWRVDLPTLGERVAVDMQLQYNTLALVSAIPGSSVCSPSGGSAWLYDFDIAKGTSPSTATDGLVGTKLGTFLGVGLTWIELTDGKSLLIIPGSNAKITTATPPTDSASASGGASRTSWRELIN